MNDKEKEALDNLIKKMDKGNISYTFIKNRLIINHHIYTIDYIIDGMWYLNNNKKLKSLKGNKRFSSFWHLASELIRDHYSTLDIFFE